MPMETCYARRAACNCFDGEMLHTWKQITSHWSSSGWSPFTVHPRGFRECDSGNAIQAAEIKFKGEVLERGDALGRHTQLCPPARSQHPWIWNLEDVLHLHLAMIACSNSNMPHQMIQHYKLYRKPFSMSAQRVSQMNQRVYILLWLQGKFLFKGQGQVIPAVIYIRARGWL